MKSFKKFLNEDFGRTIEEIEETLGPDKEIVSVNDAGEVVTESVGDGSQDAAQSNLAGLPDDEFYAKAADVLLEDDGVITEGDGDMPNIGATWGNEWIIDLNFDSPDTDAEQANGMANEGE